MKNVSAFGSIMPAHAKSTSGYEANTGNTCPQCGNKLNPDICEPSVTTRKSVKAWLKSEKEKARTDQPKPAAVENTPAAAEDQHAAPAMNGYSQLSNEADARVVSLPQVSEAGIAALDDEPEATVEVGQIRACVYP